MASTERHGIGDDVEVGGLQIEIVVVAVAGVVMLIAGVVAVATVMMAFQHEGTQDIEGQTKTRHADGFVEMDGCRVDKTRDRFIHHEQGHAAQGD